MDIRPLELEVAVDYEERGGFGAGTTLWLEHAVICELTPVDGDVAKDVVGPVGEKGACGLDVSVDDRNSCFQVVEDAVSQSLHFQVRRDGGEERTTDERVLITGETGDRGFALRVPCRTT